MAAELFQHFVQDDAVDFLDGVSLKCHDRAPIEDELRLYRFASVLLAVLDAEHRDGSFTGVREELEQLFFSVRTVERRAQLVFLRKAMSELAELLQSQEKPQPLSWARRWFQRVGENETNPAVLDLFALQWFDHFIAVTRCLHEFTPVT
jgi:hypothetical protein